MKTKFRLWLTVLFVAFFFSCQDDNITDIGSGIMPANDKILVGSVSFDVTSEDFFLSGMYTRQDSFLLGTFHDQRYGTIHADILAQVENPEGHIFPANMQADSVLFVMYYQRFFGDRYSPMQVSVYEMNKATFNFMTPYSTNINPFDFTDKSLLLGQKAFTAVDATKRNDSSFVAMKLSDEFLQRFVHLATGRYTNQNPFINNFRGIYVTPNFGSALMLYIRRLDLEFYFHYTYTIRGASGQDSTVKVNSTITFPANDRVRQVNRFMHPDTAAVRSRLAAKPTQVHYISSPANIYTRIKMPLLNMQQKMEGTMRLAINDAKLRVDIDNINTATLAQPVVNNLMLIKESEYRSFFNRRNVPNNTFAILGTVNNERNRDTGVMEYFYSFDIATLIANELKNAKETGKPLTNDDTYLLVPVRLRTDTSNNITEVSQQFLMSAVTICGGNHDTRPMRIRVVYSRF